ncbi:oligopeptide transporter [Listeria cornellensis FSL F6-0969]|uniref:Oligopeptide transporter n=1 Tax=Listeria cornellensis FSL F6-0969 TaxID=1265820 RepID=W7C8A0_9LIST|nr:oligopeptide transporter [Listeria cornellensis FSL F6-0969]
MKVFTDGFKVFRSDVQTGIYNFQNAFIGTQIYPALLGVGFIIGPKIAGQMVAGGLMASLVLIPSIAFFGAGSSDVIFPASEALKNLDASMIWDNYIRYIGAGAVAAGGLITLAKTMPAIVQTLRSTMVGLNKNKGQKMLEIERTDKDIPMKWVLIGIAVLIVIIAFDPFTNVGIIGALAIAIFGFLFVTVASRIVGIVGSSSSPVSGMTIATLLIVAIAYKSFGYSGTEGIVLTLTVAAIVCTALAVAGDISQDLKTGYLVGGTPWKQQVAMMIGVIASGLVMGYILTLLDNAYGMGSEALPAPKAALMKILAEGILNGNLPWTLIFIGVSIAVVIEFLGMNSLVFAVGLYLPLNISATVMFGGFVRLIVNQVIKLKKDKEKAERIERGTLFASGLIAGESLLGVIIAFVISINPNIIPTEYLLSNQWLPFLVFLIVCTLLYFSTVPRKRKA